MRKVQFLDVLSGRGLRAVPSSGLWFEFREWVPYSPDSLSVWGNTILVMGTVFPHVNLILVMIHDPSQYFSQFGPRCEIFGKLNFHSSVCPSKYFERPGFGLS